MFTIIIIEKFVKRFNVENKLIYKIPILIVVYFRKQTRIFYLVTLLSKIGSKLQLDTENNQFQYLINDIILYQSTFFLHKFEHVSKMEGQLNPDTSFLLEFPSISFCLHFMI